MISLTVAGAMAYVLGAYIMLLGGMGGGHKPNVAFFRVIAWPLYLAKWLARSFRDGWKDFRA